MSHKVKLSANVNSNPSMNKVNFTPQNTINVNVVKSRDIEDQEEEIKVIYDEPSPYDNLPYITPTDENVRALQTRLHHAENLVQALQLMINIIKSNPILINQLILADDEKLTQLIKYLTDADDVQIDAEELAGCCMPTKYRKVIAIYVIKNGITQNLKYEYAEIMKEIKDLGINLKFVW
jgi:hypothetical protein